MTATMHATRHRPATVWATAAVLAFLGTSAVGGGAALVLGATPPADWLDRIPLVGTWVVPGLVLGVVFGLGSLVTAYGIVRRPAWSWLRPVTQWTGYHWSWLATLLLGAGQLLWIGLELVYLPELSPLQAVYGAVGATLVALALSPGVRRYLGS